MANFVVAVDELSVAAVAPPANPLCRMPSLDENPGAASVELATQDLREIEDAAATIKVQGARYPQDLMKMTGL